MKREQRTWILAGGIIALGALLRLVHLNALPAAIFRDEAEKAYNAYSILTSGRDVHGNFLPLFINVFGVTTSAVYQYLAVPFVALFGLNEWSARLPAAAASIATLVVNYHWMRLERGPRVALWATLLLGLSPWHVLFSRWAQQGILIPLLLSSAMLFWTLFLRGRKYGLPACVVCLAAAMYTYDVARLFVPLLMLATIAIYWRRLLERRMEAGVALVAFALAAAPTAWLMLFHPDAAQVRFKAISIFSEETAAQAPVLFLKNYISHLDPRYLLLHGDSELRHSAGVGILTAVEFLAALGGIVVLLKRRRSEDKLWLAWLLLFPVAASLTRVGIPHALRTIPGIPIVQNVAALGIASLVVRFKPLRRRQLSKAIAALAILAFLPFAWSYFGRYRMRSAMSWQFGVKDALLILKNFKVPHKVIFYHMTGAEYLVAFYERLDPRIFQAKQFATTPYVFAPFEFPLPELLKRTAGEPAALVTLPYPMAGVPGTTIPLGEPAEPAAVLFLNKALIEAAGRDANTTTSVTR